MLGSLISGATSLIGGLLGKKSQEKAADKEYERQKEFAKSGIKWKVKDAESAGIHPLYALGANTVSYAPQSIGSDSLADGIASAGQNFGRAIEASRSPTERADAYTRSVQQLTLEGMRLDNDTKRAQLASATRLATGANVGPGIPTDTEGFTLAGQPNSGVPGVLLQPADATFTTPDTPWEQAGTNPDIQYANTSTGGYAPVPAKNIKQAIEDMEFSEWAWIWRNNIAPMFGQNFHPPANVPLAPGKRGWRYHPFYQEYYQYD